LTTSLLYNIIRHANFKTLLKSQLLNANLHTYK